MKTVLVAVLDWGLGHATRCIPVIRELIQQNAKVLIAGSGSSLRLLIEEFPKVKSFELPGYSIHYSEGGITLSLIAQIPRVCHVIKKENAVLKEIIKQEKVDYIISDNRYGCYSRTVKSVVICHQLCLQMPRGFGFAGKFVNYFHEKMLARFDEVWIPDNAMDSKLSGGLTQSKSLKQKYIGPLSRFNSLPLQKQTTYEIVALISGPEPQRTVFEKLVRRELLKAEKQSLLVKGMPGKRAWFHNNQVAEVNHLDARELESVMTNATWIIARSGYSTIMDLAALGKSACLVPTPGQTEQEYLARYISEKGWCYYQNQNGFDISRIFENRFTGRAFPIIHNNMHLQAAIKDWLIS